MAKLVTNNKLLRWRIWITWIIIHVVFTSLTEYKTKTQFLEKCSPNLTLYVFTVSTKYPECFGVIFLSNSEHIEVKIFYERQSLFV